jgi:hypothetical protein
MGFGPVRRRFGPVQSDGPITAQITATLLHTPCRLEISLKSCFSWSFCDSFQDHFFQERLSYPEVPVMENDKWLVYKNLNLLFFNFSIGCTYVSSLSSQNVLGVPPNTETTQVNTSISTGRGNHDRYARPAVYRRNEFLHTRTRVWYRGGMQASEGGLRFARIFYILNSVFSPRAHPVQS